MSKYKLTLILFCLLLLPSFLAVAENTHNEVFEEISSFLTVPDLKKELDETGKQGSRPFITATEDLEHIKGHDEMIKRLGFDGDFPEYKKLQSSPLYELEIIPKNEKAMEQFGLRTPIVSDYDNFIGRGRTSGGAREWDMKNQDFALNPNTGDRLLFPEGYVKKKQRIREPINPDEALGTLRVKRVINKP